MLQSSDNSKLIFRVGIWTYLLEFSEIYNKAVKSIKIVNSTVTLTNIEFQCNNLEYALDELSVLGSLLMLFSY